MRKRNNKNYAHFVRCKKINIKKILENTTIGNFVLTLWNQCGYKTIDEKDLPHLLLYGHKRGWLEDSDEINQKKPLDRRTAARIVHQFMKIEMHIPDEKDISKAEILKDLYTCRVCANHIAQVVVKKIMQPVLSPDGTTYIFDSLAPVTKKEQQSIINRLKK